MTLFKMKKPAAVFYYGSKNIGKTTVLKQLILELEKSSIAFVEKRKTRSSSDCWAAIHYRGFWVVVGTGGDTAKIIEGNFQFANKQGATIVVMASRWPSGRIALLQESKQYVSTAQVVDVAKGQSAISVETRKLIGLIDGFVNQLGASRPKCPQLSYPLFV